MSSSAGGRSPDLDHVRQMLFPDLPAEEGWARIDEAISGASDPVRWAAIEHLASDPADLAASERLAAASLSDDLLRRLNELREDRTEGSPPGD
jgi:hypothetical protein